MLILDGKVINCSKDENSKFGFVVTATQDGVTKTCWINKKGNGENYCRVYCGNSYEAKEGKVSFYYLHKIVFASAMGWDRLDIAPNYHVHHLNHSGEIKENPAAYNDITNLIYLPRSEHQKLHSYEKKVRELSASLEFKTPEERQLTWIEMNKYEHAIYEIERKYIAIRDNRIKKLENEAKMLDNLD